MGVRIVADVMNTKMDGQNSEQQQQSSDNSEEEIVWGVRFVFCSLFPFHRAMIDNTLNGTPVVQCMMTDFVDKNMYTVLCF